MLQLLTHFDQSAFFIVSVILPLITITAKCEHLLLAIAQILLWICNTSSVFKVISIPKECHNKTI